MYNFSNFSFIIPFKYDTDDRVNNLNMVMAFYRKYCENLQFIIVECDLESSCHIKKLNLFDNDKHVFCKITQDLFCKSLSYNIGASVAERQILICTDTDVVVNPDCIFNTTKIFSQNKKLSAIKPYNGIAIYYKRHISEKFIESDYDFNYLLSIVPNKNDLKPDYKNEYIDTVGMTAPGGCIVFKRDCFINGGGYNPNFINWGYEDDEILIRFKKLEYEIAMFNGPTTLLWHFDHKSKNKANHSYYLNNERLVQHVRDMDVHKIRDYIRTWQHTFNIVNSVNTIHNTPLENKNEVVSQKIIEKYNNDRIVINLKDHNFSGDDSCCFKATNKHIEWFRGDEEVSTSCFITDQDLTKVDTFNVKRKIAWLMEPRGISAWMYDWIKENYNKFDYVLTYDQELLNMGKNFLWYPHGRRWVQDVKESKKTAMCSIIASGKRSAPGHILRHEVIEKYKQYIDVYGKAYKYVEDTDEALKQYYFSLTIENTQQPFYWTEKVIDCFAAKTVPIYWGNRHIEKFFNKDGIIFFDSIEELEDILKGLSKEKYKKMKDAIEDNYKKHFQYAIPDDWLFENYPWMFKEV